MREGRTITPGQRRAARSVGSTVAAMVSALPVEAQHLPAVEPGDTCRRDGPAELSQIRGTEPGRHVFRDHPENLLAIVLDGTASLASTTGADGRRDSPSGASTVRSASVRRMRSARRIATTPRCSTRLSRRSRQGPLPRTPRCPNYPCRKETEPHPRATPGTELARPARLPATRRCLVFLCRIFQSEKVFLCIHSSF